MKKQNTETMDSFIVGRSYKQSSGYSTKILGVINLNGESIFVTETDRPEDKYMLYWDNGNSYGSNKNIDTSNYTIRACNIIQD